MILASSFALHPADIAKEPIFGLLVSFFVKTKPYSAIYR